MQDCFLTIEGEGAGIYREKGSKFLAFAFHCDDIQAFESRLDILRKEHPKARHFCYAYILDVQEKVFRYNDDGEPSGSAGLPIYNQIRSTQLKETAVVVIRYFGGKKLGVPGLINAYKEATIDAFSGVRMIEKYVCDVFRITFGFEQTGQVMRALNHEEVSVIENGFETTPVITFAVRQTRSEEIIHKLHAFLLNRSVADISGDEFIPGFSCNKTGIIHA